jgi:hypothetical protein
MLAGLSSYCSPVEAPVRGFMNDCARYYRQRDVPVWSYFETPKIDGATPRQPSIVPAAEARHVNYYPDFPQHSPEPHFVLLLDQVQGGTYKANKLLARRVIRVHDADPPPELAGPNVRGNHRH